MVGRGVALVTAAGEPTYSPLVRPQFLRPGATFSECRTEVELNGEREKFQTARTIESLRTLTWMEQLKNYSTEGKMHAVAKA